MPELTREEKLLKTHEGLRLKPYRCTAGALTIGIGRNLDANGISEDEAILLMRNDLAKCKAQVATLDMPADLGEVRTAVLVNMCFNLGFGGLKSFKNTLSLIRNRRFKEAADAMGQSKWARQVGQRAVTLRRMMETGRWPD